MKALPTVRRDDRPRIAVTMGDPAGIGPELCLHVLKAPEVLAVAIPVVFGDAGVLARVAVLLKTAGPRNAGYWPAGVPCMPLADWERGAAISGPTVVDCRSPIVAEAVQPGQVSADCGQAAALYVETATRAAEGGRVAALVTAPLHKEALHLAGIAHPGHTEMLAALTGAPRARMMLACDDLAVSLVTIHVALAAVQGLLTIDGIVDTALLTAAVMQRLGRPKPRLVVCGLNPHAGESGLFGQEEIETVAPAVAQLRAQGLVVDGPLPPDTAFLPARRAGTDAYIAMYHDQGLIPLKLLAFDRAVNITLGLPIVRTSVDHGTAFDIAWQGKASPTSLVEAIRWAVRLSG